MAGSEAEERNQEVEDSEDSAEEAELEELEENGKLGEEYKQVYTRIKQAEQILEETDSYMTDKMDSEKRLPFLKLLMQHAASYGNAGTYDQLYYNSVWAEAKKQLPDGDEESIKNLAHKLIAKDAKGDLEFLLNNENSPMLLELAEKFTKKIDIQYKGLSKERLQVLLYEGLRKGLEKAGAKVPEDQLTDVMKKYMTAVNGNGDEKAKKARDEIIDEVVDFQFKETYSKEDLKSDTVKARKFFVAASYKRRFKLLKENALKDYAHMHNKEFKQWVDAAAKAIAYKTGENAGKARREGIEAYGMGFAKTVEGYKQRRF